MKCKDSFAEYRFPAHLAQQLISASDTPASTEFPLVTGEKVAIASNIGGSRLSIEDATISPDLKEILQRNLVAANFGFIRTPVILIGE